MSFKPSVSTDGDATFNENALAFATPGEAEISAKDLMARWLLVTDWRVIEPDEPVNYAIKDGMLEAVAWLQTTRKSSSVPTTVHHRSASCSNCGICANTERKAIVGFPARGAGKKRVAQVFTKTRAKNTATCVH